MRDYNAEGQHHANVYVKPKQRTTLLYYPDGTPTGFTIPEGMLRYKGKEAKYDGHLRLDHHEVIESKHGRLLFHRGGKGFKDAANVKYGHVLLHDLAESPGHGVPSGDGRGEPAHTVANYRVRVTSIPGDMYYKPKSPGSHWPTYGDPAADQGDRHDIHYSYLLWSFLNVGGGGLVRALLQDDQAIRLTNVRKIRAKSYGRDGKINGEVIGAYVLAKPSLYGWMVWGHQRRGEPFIPHVEAV